jgi:hypothetical protein
MSDIAAVERLESESLQVTSRGVIRDALTETTKVSKRLPPALRSLERALDKASVARRAQYAPELLMLQGRLVTLAAEIRAVRLMTLEMAHFLEHWHPIGPSFGQQGRSQAGP